MSSLITKKSVGVCVAVLGLWAAGSLQAQVVKGLNNATKTVTAPLKDTQKATKTAVEPIKDTRKAAQDIKRAPQEIKREVDNTERAFDNAGNEVKRAKSDIDKAADKLDGNRSSKPDSVAKSPSGSGKTVIIDQRTGREGVREGSGYGNLQSGGQAGESGAESASTEPNYDYRRVLLPPGKGKTNLKSASKASKAGSSSAASAPAAPVKPDYSGSPAREALESADFNMATLQDLFDYAVWDGPEKDHTMRSIDYTLKQLKRDIDEIRYKDPDRSVWNYEKSYRDWRDAYVQHGGQ